MTEAIWFALGTINGAFWFWLGMHVGLRWQRKMDKIKLDENYKKRAL